ncbi:hypothetical protein HRbin01_01818 [archaeon HR01]|nr:hypothetical protein HRbin01_01818 [archaeon HR01]
MTHLKSLAAPPHYPKPLGVFATTPRPGPHPKDRSLPLILVVRDMLGLAEDSRTAKKLIKAGKFRVDGRIVKEPRFPIGLMDVLSVEELGEDYRVITVPRAGLKPVKIPADEAGYKICQIRVKKMVRGGRLQLGLHDGRSILLDRESEYSSLRRLDSLKISIPGQEILDVARLEVNSYVLIHSGSKAGYHGRLKEVARDVAYPAKPTVEVLTSSNSIKTILSHVMPVGVDSPWIALP